MVVVFTPVRDGFKFVSGRVNRFELEGELKLKKTVNHTFRTYYVLLQTTPPTCTGA
jgi:hypothetical protein